MNQDEWKTMQASHRNEIEERLRETRNAALHALNEYRSALADAIKRSYPEDDHRIKHYAECSIRANRAIDGIKRLDGRRHN